MTATTLLCIAGGGTGGHVMPALALADAARDEWPELNVSFIGAERGLEAKLLPERDEEVLLLTMHSVQGASAPQKVRVLLWELPRAVLQIRRHWRRQRPALLVGVGGYASVTGVLAALISGVPVILYEQNAIPGMVNRKLARFCQKIMLGFAEAMPWLPAGKTVVTGNMVRDAIRAIRWESHKPPRLLVLGGSQGAAFLNTTIPAACRLLKEDGHQFAVTHIAGNDEAADKARATYAAAGIEAEVLSFCNEMERFYASGDLLVARSGAMTVGEVTMCGIPAIFIPLPHAADNHQYHNAKAVAERGGAIIIEQSSLSPASMADRIDRLLFTPARLARMSNASRELAGERARADQLAVIRPWLTPAGERGV